jgi:hypothetical protein
MEKPTSPDWSEFRRMRRRYHLGIAILPIGILTGLAGSMIHPALGAVSLLLTLVFALPLMYPSQMYLKAFGCPRCGNKFSGEWHDAVDLSECRWCLLPMYAGERNEEK